MRYPAVITKDGRSTVAVFPDCPGCATQADPGERIEDQAAEALQGWLEAHLITGDVPPRPPRRAPKGKTLLVEIPARLAVKNQNGADFQLTIPVDTPLTFSIQSSDLKLADVNGTPLPANANQQPFQQNNGDANPKSFQYNITGVAP